MANIHQRNSNGSQIEHEDTKGNIRQDLMMNQNIPVSEEENTQSISTGQITDFGSTPVSQKKNENININANSDPKIAKDMVNDIDSTHIAQSIGDILRRARITNGMSTEDVSRKLRLSVQQIEVIERDDFDKLPGRTFMRGFIRNYAKLVRLDPVQLLQMLPESAQAISAYERATSRDKQISLSSSREKSVSNRLVIVSLLFITILGAYFIFEDINWNKKLDNNLLSREIKQNTEEGSMEIELPLSPTIKDTTNTQANKSLEASNQTNKETYSEIGPGIKTEVFTFPIENKSFIQEIEKQVAVSSDLGNLYFKFNDDSWVRVIDGDGVSLLEQLKKKGSAQSITGKRPLSVVIGNALGVNLTYNDTEVDIFSYKKRDGTARFTLQ